MAERVIHPVRLRDLIVDLFEPEELDDLMFELSIRRADIPGATHNARVRELVEYCSRANLLDALYAACVQHRPAVDWSPVWVDRAEGDAAVVADPRLAAALGEVRTFQALLDEGRQIYLRNNEQRGRLQRLIYANHAQEIPPKRGYDDLFYKMYDRLNEEEMELFRIVRGNTLVGMHRINSRIRDWVDNHNILAIFPEQTPPVLALENEVKVLRTHLSEWFAKYEETFKPDPKRALVYLNDEKKHGTGWPPGLNAAVAAVLAEG
jgi:hypothetical protein